MLNGRGLPAPGGRAWTKGTLWAILRNPIYMGTVAYAKARYSEIGKKRGKARRPVSEWTVVKGAVPAIVPMDLWSAAQAKQGTRKFGIGRPWHRPYLLSGLILCGRCGKRFQAHKQSRGLIPAYYICGSYLTSGAGVCDGLRLPVTYMDEVVVDGIRKRIERVLDRDALTARLRERLQPEPPADLVEILEVRFVEVKRRIGNLVDVLAAGADDLPSVTTRLAELERERGSLEVELARVKIQAATKPPELTTTVNRLLDELGRFTEVWAAGEEDERKALVRAFLQEIRIEKATGQATLKWYRLPRLAEPLKMVELRGLEPLTPRLPALCSPN